MYTHTSLSYLFLSILQNMSSHSCLLFQLSTTGYIPAFLLSLFVPFFAAIILIILTYFFFFFNLSEYCSLDLIKLHPPSGHLLCVDPETPFSFKHPACMDSYFSWTGFLSSRTITWALATFWLPSWREGKKKKEKKKERKESEEITTVLMI